MSMYVTPSIHSIIHSEKVSVIILCIRKQKQKQQKQQEWQEQQEQQDQIIC